MPIEQRDFEHFMNQARIKLTGASDAGIKAELYEVLHEFFANSNSWCEHLHIQAVAGQREYSLIPKDNAQIIRLVGVWDQNHIFMGGTMDHFGVLRLRHKPQSTPPAKWTVIVIQNVALPTTREDVPVAPDWVLRVYPIVILDGLLGKMMGQQHKSFSDSATSLYHLRRFRDGTMQARTAAARENLLGGQTWQFPRNFRSEGQRGGVSTAYPWGY